MYIAGLPKSAGGLVDRALQPRRQRRRVPAGRRLLQARADLRAVGRIAQQQLLEQFAGALRPSSVGGRRSDSLTAVCGRSTLPAIQRRHAVGAGDRQRRAPGAVEHQLGQVVVHRRMPGRSGNLS
jgi:hypothetical protein